MHELYHILKHLPNMPRIVGVNMMDEQFEEEADGFGGGVAEVIKKDHSKGGSTNISGEINAKTGPSEIYVS